MIQLVILLILEIVLIRVYNGDMRLASYVNNIISHSLLSTMALVTFTIAPDDDLKSQSSTEFELFCGDWLYWYFVLDMCRMAIGITEINSIYVIHHIFGIILLITIEKSGMLHRYIPVICIFEASSIPLNVRYALLHTGKDKMSKNVIYSELAFFVSFIIVRWIFGFNKAYEVVHKLMSLENKTGVEKALTTSTTIIVLIFVSMHIYWTIGLVKRAVKVVRRSKQKMPKYKSQ